MTNYYMYRYCMPINDLAICLKIEKNVYFYRYIEHMYKKTLHRLVYITKGISFVYCIIYISNTDIQVLADHD